MKRREAKRLYKKSIFGDDFSDSGSDSSGSSSGSEFLSSTELDNFNNIEDYLLNNVIVDEDDDNLIDYENEDNKEGVKIIKKLSLNVGIFYFESFLKKK